MNADHLSRQLSSEQESRKEERFIWSIVVLFLTNVILIDVVGANLIWLLVFEFIFLFVFGRVCGVDYIYEETQRAIDTVARMRGAKKNEPKDSDETE